MGFSRHPKADLSASFWRRALLLALTLACWATTSGCRTYATKTESVRSAWANGQVDLALKTFSERVKNSGDGRDGVIWRLEEATALRAAGRFEESNRSFELAEAQMAEYAQRARVRVGNEAMSAMTTPANLPYEGRSYDRIMAATYRALNYLALGRPTEARPALFKAYQYQQDAVAENARRIERAQADATNSSHSATVRRTQDNPAFQRQVDTLYKPVAQLRPYAEYVNPFTVWLDGIFFAAQAQDLSDLERARKSFERALSFAPDNPYIRADLEAMDRRLKGTRPEPVTYVVFESGLSAIRQQVRIDIPIIFANVSYIGSAWPVLQTRGGNALALGAVAGQGRFNTATVANIDSVIARDFEDEKPAIVTRTLVSTLAKGAAAFVVNQAASQQDEGLGALVRIATLAYQASVNIADTRSWTTLPKEFQIARIPTPPDRRIQLLEGNQAPLVVTVEDAPAVLVYVRSVGGHRPLQVIQSRLK